MPWISDGLNQKRYLNKNSLQIQDYEINGKTNIPNGIYLENAGKQKK